ncbi:MAG TPA: flagellar protein FlaG [Syntrophomonadaceae bacterium]|nr:flagellar protein FlaG [Syntrophomonadaceae bacterium]
MRVEGQAAAQDFFPVLIGGKVPNSDQAQQDKTVENKKAAKSQEITDQDLQGAVDFANNVMKISNYHLQFVRPEKGSEIQVKVIDSDNGKVIREIPPDYMMKIAEQLKSNVDKACGITVDELA